MKLNFVIELPFKDDGQCIDLTHLNSLSDKRYELVLAEGRNQYSQKTFVNSKVDTSALMKIISEYSTKTTTIRQHYKTSSVTKITLSDSVASHEPELVEQVSASNSRHQEMWGDNTWLLDNNEVIIKHCVDLIECVEDLNSQNETLVKQQSSQKATEYSISSNPPERIQIANNQSLQSDLEKIRKLEEDLAKTEGLWDAKFKIIQKDFALELDDFRTRLAEKDKLISQKEILINELRFNFETTDKELKRAKESLAENRMSIESKYKNFEELNRYITDLFKDKKKMNEILDAKEKHIAELRLEIEELRATQTVTNSNDQKWKSEIERLTNLNISLQARVRSTENDCTNKLKKVENLIQEKEAKYLEIYQAYEKLQTVQAKTTVTKSTTVTVTKLNKRLKNVEDDLTTKDNWINEIKENIEKEKKSSGKENNWQVSFATTRKLEAQVSRLRLRVEELENQIEERDSQALAENNDYSSLQVIIARLNRRIKELENDLAAKDKVLESSSKDNKNSASTDFNDYIFQINRLQLRVRQLEDDNKFKDDLLANRGINDDDDSNDTMDQLKISEAIITNLHKKIKELEEESDILRKKIKQNANPNNSNNNDISDHAILIERLKLRIMYLEDDLALKEQLLEARRTPTAVVTSDTSDIRILHKRINENQLEIDEKNQTIDKLKSKLRTIEEELAQKTVALTEISEKNVNNDKGLENQERLKKRIKNLEADVDEREEIINQLKREKKNLQQELESAANSNNNDRPQIIFNENDMDNHAIKNIIQELEATIEDRERAIYQYKIKINSLEEEIATKNTTYQIDVKGVGKDNHPEVERLKKQMKEFENVIEDKEQENDKLQLKIKTLEDQLASKQSTHNIEIKSTVSSKDQSNEINQLKKRISELQDLSNEKEVSEKALKRKIKSLEDELLEKDKAIEVIKIEYSNTRTSPAEESLKKQIRELEITIETKEQNLDQLKRKIAMLENDISSQKSPIRRASTMNNVNNEENRLKNQIAELKNLIEEKEKLAAESNRAEEIGRKRIRELEDELDEKSRKNDEFKRKINFLENENAELLDRLAEQNNNSNVEDDHLKNKIEELEKLIEDRNRVIKELTRNDNISNQESLKKEIGFLKFQIASLQRQLNDKNTQNPSDNITIKNRSTIDNVAEKEKNTMMLESGQPADNDTANNKERYEEEIDSLKRQLKAQKNADKFQASIVASRIPYDENYYINHIKELESEIVSLKAKIEALGSLNKSNVNVEQRRATMFMTNTNPDENPSKLKQKIAELELTIINLKAEKATKPRETIVDNNIDQARKIRNLEMSEELERLRAKVKDLSKQLEDQEAVINQQNVQVRKSKFNLAELKDLKSELENLKRTQVEVSKKTSINIEESNNSKFEQTPHNDSLKQMIATLQQDLKDRDVRIAEKNKELQALITLEKENDSLQLEVRKLKDQVKEMQEAEVSKMRLNELMDDKIKSAGYSIAELQSKLNEKENECFDLKSQIRRLAGIEQELSSANEDIAKLKKRLAEAQEARERAQRGALQEQELLKELELIRKKLDNKKEKSRKFKLEILVLKNDMERLSTADVELNRIRQKVIELQVTIESKENMINVLKNKDDAAEGHLKVIEDQKNQINFLKKIQEEESENNRTLRREVAELRPIAQTQLENEKQMLSLTAEIRRLKTIDEDLSLCRADLQRLKQKIVTLEEDIFTKESIIKSMEKSQNNSQAGSDSFKAIIAQQNNQIQLLNKKIEEDIEVNRQLNRQILELKAKNDDLYNINTDNNDKISKLKEHMNYLETSLNEAKDKNEQLLSIISQIQQSYETRIVEIYNEKNTEYETTIRATYGQLVEAQQYIVLMQTRMEELETRNSYLENDNREKENRIITITREFEQKIKEEITRTNNQKTEVKQIVKVKAKEPIADYNNMLESQQNLIRNLKSLLEETKNEQFADKIDFAPQEETGKAYAECMIQYLDKGHKFYKELARIIRELAEEASKVPKLEKEMKSLKAKPTNINQLVDALHEADFTSEYMGDILKIANGGKMINTKKFDVNSDDPELFFEAIHNYFLQNQDFYKQLKDSLVQKNKELASLRAFEKEVKSGKNKMASLEDYKNISLKTKKVNGQLIEVLKRVSDDEVAYREDEYPDSDLPDVIFDRINADFDKSNKFFRLIFTELDDLRDDLKRLKGLEQEFKGKPKLDDLEGLRKILNDEVTTHNLARDAYRLLKPELAPLQLPSLTNVSSPVIYIDTINGLTGKTRNILKELCDALNKLITDNSKLQSQLAELKALRSPNDYLHDIQTIFNNTDKLNSQFNDTYNILPQIGSFEQVSIKIDSNDFDSYVNGINTYLKKSNKSLKDISDWIEHNNKELQRLKDFERDVKSGNYKMNALDDLKEIYAKMKTNLRFEQQIAEEIMILGGNRGKSFIFSLEEKPNEYLSAIHTSFQRWENVNKELKDLLSGFLEDLDRLKKFERDVRTGKFKDNCLKDFTHILEDEKHLAEEIKTTLDRLMPSDNNNNFEGRKTVRTSLMDIKVFMNNPDSMLEAISKYHENSLKTNSIIRDEVERMMAELKRLQNFEKDVLSGANKIAALNDFIKIFNGELANAKGFKEVIEKVTQRKFNETFDYPSSSTDPHEYLSGVFDLQEKVKRMIKYILEVTIGLSDELKITRDERDKLKLERDRYLALYKQKEEELEITIRKLKVAEGDLVSIDTLRLILSNQIKTRKNLNSILEVVGERNVIDNISFNLSESNVKILISSINSNNEIINLRTEEIQNVLSNRKTPSIDPNLVLRLLEKIEAYKRQFKDYYEIICDENYADTVNIPSIIGLTYERAVDLIGKNIDLVDRMLEDFREANSAKISNLVRTLNLVKDEKTRIETLFHDLQEELNKKSGLIGKLQIKLFMTTSFLQKVLTQIKNAE